MDEIIVESVKYPLFMSRKKKVEFIERKIMNTIRGIREAYKIFYLLNINYGFDDYGLVRTIIYHLDIEG